MNKSVRSDVVSFLRQITAAFKPIARAEAISLTFLSTAPVPDAFFHPATLAADISAILTKIIELIPEKESITVAVSVNHQHKCHVTIANTGINLSVTGEIPQSCRLPVSVVAGPNSTSYILEIQLLEESVESTPNEPSPSGKNYIADYYAEVRKRLLTHFNKSENLVAGLAQTNPREAAFLNKVNQTILANLQNAQFDANLLSDLMHMSRTQLFRRLKPIINESPGSYIRQLKLQKAKELFETTDLRISEVAYQTGFETASHFTKVFTKKYGVKPSLFCRRGARGTNEG